MSKVRKIFVTICVLCSLLVFTLVGCGEETLASHKDEDAFYVGGLSVKMLEASYYIMEREDFYNDIAKEENPTNPKVYWNGYLFAAGSYFKTWVKQQAYEVCICDNIYYKEAIDNGFELELAYQVLARDEAQSIYDSMTDKQKKQTELTLDDIYNIMLKKKYRAQYVESLVVTEELKSYPEGAAKALEMEGSYYKKLLEKYDVRINEDCIWNELELGSLTIN